MTDPTPPSLLQESPTRFLGPALKFKLNIVARQNTSSRCGGYNPYSIFMNAAGALYHYNSYSIYLSINAMYGIGRGFFM